MNYCTMKNLNTCFPFYDALDEQVRFKGALTPVPFILSLNTKLPPFVIRRVHSAGVVADLTVFVYPCNGGNTIEIHGDDFGLSISTGTSYDYIQYLNGTLPAALPASDGGYYLVVQDAFPATDKLWYSETFGVRTSVSEFFKITFSCNTQLSNILAAFVQVAYFDTFFRAPEYPREETGDKRDGVLIKEKQVILKSETLAIQQSPEYLIDALLLLPLNDIVTVSLASGDYTYVEIKVKDPEWSDQGFARFGKIELQFINVLAIKKLNFKESTTGGIDMGYLQQGGPVLTTASGRYFTYQVVFDDDMPDTNYTPAAVAVSTGEMTDAELPKCTNVTIHGFLITTTIACEVRWSAVKQ